METWEEIRAKVVDRVARARAAGYTIVVVTASREWLGESLESLMYQDLRQLQRPVLVVDGDCRGGDLMARRLSGTLGFRTTSLPADWQRRGHAAGPERNQALIDLKPDRVLAFPLPQSVGTRDCIERARAAGIPCHVTEGW